VPIIGQPLKDYRAGDNRVLTGLAHGYGNSEMAGKYLSPLAPVDSRVGTVTRFDDSIYETYPDDRAPGTRYNQIQTGYSSIPFALKNKGLMYPVPEEFNDEAAQASITLGKIAQMALSNAEALNLEVEQMQMLTTTSNYPSGNILALSGTSRFDDLASTPGATVRSVKSVVASIVGKAPNVIVSGDVVSNALAGSPDVQKQYFQTNSATIDDAKLAAYFGVDKYITARGLWRNPTTNAREFIWGKSMFLAYVDPAALASGTVNYGTTANQVDRMSMPAAFYTYVKRGHPIVSDPFWDEFSDTWNYKIKFERGSFQVLPGAAFWLQTVVS
jgi:hypothetical protein